MIGGEGWTGYGRIANVSAPRLTALAAGIQVFLSKQTFRGLPASLPLSRFTYQGFEPIEAWSCL